MLPGPDTQMEHVLAPHFGSSSDYPLTGVEVLCAHTLSSLLEILRMERLSLGSRKPVISYIINLIDNLLTYLGRPIEEKITSFEPI